MKILITGACGFIGMHLSERLLSKGFEVVGIDNLSQFSNYHLKKSRHARLKVNQHFKFINLDVSEINKIEFNERYDCIIHLAAHAGVRESFNNSYSYIKNNILAHLEMLKFGQKHSKKFIYASSSSVYGSHKNIKSKENHVTDNPSSIYGITKKSCEMISKNFFDVTGYPSLGLRFFSVYGQYGRPDMVYWNFTRKIINDERITLLDHGNHLRDFTFISDIVDGVEKLIVNFNFQENLTMNLGNGNPRKITELLAIIEKLFAKKSKVKYIDGDVQDVPLTSSDNSLAYRLIKYSPKVSLEEGMSRFVKWYKDSNINY
tara:strand:+ start:55 stop:1005 length:951 start_codon:yes stop_codon:yes gene_type:complete